MRPIQSQSSLQHSFLLQSTNEGRIAQNLELDFTIDQDDMTFLDNIGRIGKIKPYRS